MVLPADARVMGLLSEAVHERDFGNDGANRERAMPSSSRRKAPHADPPALPSAADLFVPSLPGIPNMSTHPTHPLNVYAGEIPSYPGAGNGGGEGDTGIDAQIFFMMVRARRSAGKQRVIFWFNGGPGCSSFDGSLMEIGPFRTVPKSQTESGKAELKLVEGGWEEYATVVYVDQPPGVGYSFVPTNGYLHELDQASQHLIHFMANLYKVFPDLQGQETYLAGESFAGQYIPYFTDALLKTRSLPNLNLRGIAIGNGWVDPLRQYPAYAEFAYEKKLITKGSAEAQALEAALAECETEMAKWTDPLKTPINIGSCGEVMQRVQDPFTKDLNDKKVCLNIYDVRLTDDYPACGLGWPPDLPDVYDFLRRPDVKTALHADMHSAAWVECSSRVGQELRLASSPASVHLLPSILERGVQVLMFAGAEDLICNYIGIERMIENLIWSGDKGWGNTTSQAWSLNGTAVGEWVETRNLSYAKIFDASHMVGFDVPHVTNDMIMRFMGVDINLLPGVTGTMGSKIGEAERMPVHFGELKKDEGMPLLKGGKGDWEAWYNAISAFFILFILLSIVGVYLFFRRRRLRGVRLRPATADGDREEREPLAAAEYEMEDSRVGKRDRKGKGKARARDSEEFHDGPTVFAIEDEEEAR